jgi:uncharacterized membrane protein YiaA
MEKAFEIFGSILLIILGVLLMIIGVYNVVINIQQGSFFALSWLIAPVLGGWFIDCGCKELKK